MLCDDCFEFDDVLIKFSEDLLFYLKNLVSCDNGSHIILCQLCYNINIKMSMQTRSKTRKAEEEDKDVFMG